MGLLIGWQFCSAPDIVQAMKLVRYRSATGEEPGLILDGEVFDVSGQFCCAQSSARRRLMQIEAIAAIPAKALSKMREG